MAGESESNLRKAFEEVSKRFRFGALVMIGCFFMHSANYYLVQIASA